MRNSIPQREHLNSHRTAMVMKAIDIALIATLVVLLAILAARFFFPASMPF